MKTALYHGDTEGLTLNVNTGSKLKHGEITEKVIGCAIEVHKELGPGLLEGIYEACLSIALKKAGIQHEVQKSIPIFFQGQKIDKTYCMDLIVDDQIVVELKAVDALLPIHRAQLMTYMKLTHKPYGLLVNFNETLLKNGIRRVILDTEPDPSVSPWSNGDDIYD